MEQSISSGNPLNYSAVKSAAMTLRAVNHKMRQQMLQLIHDSKRISVTDVYVKLRIEQSVASQHLAILRRAEIVSTFREGKMIYYSVNYAQMEKVAAFARNVALTE